MAVRTITVGKFYLNVIRRSKNDLMDHYISDTTRKHTLPKYISLIDKDFIYVKPITNIGGNKDIVEEKILKFDFSGRDTLSIARTNKEVSESKENRIQLKGVNTNDKNIVKTSKYEGISDEDNLYYLLALKPLKQLKEGEHFQFNLWWLGENPIQDTPIGGGIPDVDILKIQNPNITDNLIITQGIAQSPQKLEKIDIKPVTSQQQKIDNQTLIPKLNKSKIVLDF